MTAIKNAFDAAAAQAPAPAAIVGHRDPAAAALILRAGKAAASMFAACKEAATIAAAQLNPALPMAERIETVVSLYATDFATAGHNVKALFKDALTLHACGQTPVTVTVTGKDGKKEEQHITAKAALTMPKHALKDAVKQAREAHGIGRKAGGGRKPKAAPKTPAAAPAPDMASEVDGFTAWLDNLEAYLTDPIFHQKIVARAIECGFSINKAVKGRKVTGTASA
jgi:hypothetical protein